MEERFELVSDFKPEGDQPRAIAELIEGIRRGDRHQTLLGVTGSGKSFTMACVAAELNRPTLVMAPNKTLAAQLYQSSSRSSSPITRSNTSSPITTTTSPRPISPPPIPSSRRTRR